MTSPNPEYPQPPQPQPYTPQPVKKKSSTTKILLIVAGGLVGLCCIGGVIGVAAAGGEDDKATTAPAGGTAKAGDTTKADGKPAAKANPKVGTAVKDGQFEFTVTNVEYGKTQVGGQYTSKKAQGQFVLVTVAVKNIGKEPRMLTGANQTAFGPGGVKYNNDGSAEYYANEGNFSTFLENINPGNAVNGVLVFDVPKDTKLTKIELHDALFSGGVTVDLT